MKMRSECNIKFADLINEGYRATYNCVKTVDAMKKLSYVKSDRYAFDQVIRCRNQ
ncbi:hypothetical protein HanIR_Chr14g0718651 [Helianthus annuus]|nr:hypothetical protein HanIR_Chr14g0718651 [Helianthus annuus]